ncbi:MAG TPA: AMP-binding protein [Candidatus Limnocylindrales bacterium]|nr:AMP-binding protein [Candidatus Limnocylindrales bacterium]
MNVLSDLVRERCLILPQARPRIPGDAPQSVAAVLERGLRNCPQREALVGRHSRYTYATLDRAADQAAAALWELGVRPGDRVAACTGNHPDIVIAFLGCMRLGAIWVGINRPLAAPEKAYMLADSEACLFLGERAMCEQVRARRHDVPSLRHVCELEAGDGGCEWHRLLAHATSPAPKVDIDPFAPAAIAYTSGTTGFPKGAVHSQHNLLIPGAVAAATAAYPQGQIQGVLLPLTILNLMVLVPLLAFQIQGCCVCMDRIDAVGVAEWVRSERIGHFAAVPAIYHDLLTNPQVDRNDLATLVRPEVGGAECPPAFLQLYRERFGADVSIGYGMTEAPTAVTRSLGDRPPTPGLIGRPLPQVEIRLLDGDGRDVAPGEVGEICVAPARDGLFAGVYTPMLGYWGKPQETAKALRDGILHTGDLGAVGEDGDLYIRGRRNELILRGGANVYPAEIERVVHQDPRVAACAVLGIPDERLGERVVAAVQLAEGASVTEEELRERCAAELARYKIPERFYFVASLPRNSMGKIVKRDLRTQLGLV